MWKKWLFLLGVTFVLQVALPSTSAERTRPGMVRRRRAEPEQTAVGQIESSPSTMTYITDTMMSLAQGPLNLFWSIASVPLTMIQNGINWGMRIAWNFVEALVIRIWGIVKSSVVPMVDRIFIRIAASESVPPQIKTLLMSFHTTYQFMQFFGFMKPE